MTLSQDELRPIMKELIKCNIDLNQGINYFLSSKYEAGHANLLDVIDNLREIIQKVNA